MDAELLSILSNAATEAESHLGECFTGPDGKTYIGVFQAPDAFQLSAAGLEMYPNGFQDRTLISFICTVGQFNQPPLPWRGKTVIRTQINPRQVLVIKHVTTDDPLHFGFVAINQQPARQSV